MTIRKSHYMIMTINHNMEEVTDLLQDTDMILLK